MVLEVKLEALLLRAAAVQCDVLQAALARQG